MKFEEALSAMREGKKVRRAGWATTDYIKLRDDREIVDNMGQRSGLWVGHGENLFATDWEILPDPEPEPQWLLLEPGMTIKEGDEIWTDEGWAETKIAGCRVILALIRRRIAK